MAGLRSGNTKNVYLPLARQHCHAGSRWAHEIATDYWLQPSTGLDQAGAASTATGDELAENGWVATSLVNTAGAGADFGSSADINPNHFLCNADTDLLRSPYMFGDYTHMQAAGRLVSKGIPTSLNLEVWGAMTVHSGNDIDSGWGFIEDGGVQTTSTSHIAMIYSDSANFALQANGVIVGSVGAADDALWHLFKIKLTVADLGLEWFIDGVSQGARVANVIQTDEAPWAFGFGAGATNMPGLGITHVWYDWV
jgi:hypothetical protein